MKMYKICLICLSFIFSFCFAGATPCSRSINVAEFGAKGNGIQDDTAPLQKAINYAAAHGIKEVFLPKGIYCINVTGHDTNGDVLVIDGESHFFDMICAGLMLKSGVDIIFDDGATLQAVSTAAPEYAIMYIGEQNNITISGGTIIGERNNHQGNAGQHGMCIWIQSSSNIEINNCDLSQGWGDCLYVGCKWDSRIEIGSNQSNNVRVINCTLHDSRRQGISVVGCKELYVKDCHIYNIAGSLPQAGVDLEVNNNNYPNRNCVFENICIHDCEGGGIIGYTTSTHGVSIVSSDIQSVNLSCADDVIIDQSIIGNAVFDNYYNVPNDKIRLSRCKIKSISLYSSGMYSFEARKCTIGGDIILPAIAFVKRNDIDGKQDLLVFRLYDCTLFSNYGVNLISTSVRPNLVLIDNSRFSSQKRTILNAKDLHLKNNTFEGRCVTMDVLAQNVKMMSNTIVTDRSEKNVYGYLLMFMAEGKVEFSRNIVKGEKKENRYVVIPKDYSPIFVARYNEAKQYSRIVDAGSNVKIKATDNILIQKTDLVK